MDQNVLALLLLSGTFCTSLSAPQQYYYVAERKTWAEAQSYCRATYIDLAAAGCMEEMNRLTATVDPSYRDAVWIGLKRGWAMSTGENISSYQSWGSGQPNEGSALAACGLSTPGGWHDYYCNETFYFVCFDDRTNLNGTFVLITTKKNWTEAQRYCSQYHTILASIRNAQEQQRLVQISGSDWAWFDLISGQWSDNGFSTFRYWEDGQQAETASTEKCAAINMSDSGKWLQSQCDLQNPFICYGGLRPLSRLYYFIKDPRTWAAAQTYCRTRLTDLATVDSVKDVSGLEKIVDPGYNGSLWIGLSRATQARWGWSRGEELLSIFSNWAVGRPNGTGQCGSTVNGLWQDNNCANALQFVCYHEGNPSGYIWVQTSKSWFDAQTYCRANYTDLASIRSPWEQKQVTSLVAKGVSVWVGLFLDTWQWSDQWSLLYRHWAAGQPSSGTGDCSAVVMANSGKWTADNCNVQRPFICYGGESQLFQCLHCYINSLTAEDRMKKKQIIRVTVSSKADPNVPSTKDTILKEIKKKLQSLGMANDSMLTWRQGSNSKVFTLKPKL